MKRLFLSKTVRRMLPGFARKSESGQAIILLALGFVALLAFVGIVTDVSLMFVRYSTLSRAVDAAAIAAAGQMRSDRSFGEVGLAARQFIEFHGLDPLDVLVETCQSTNNTDPGLCPLDQRKLVRVTATIMSPTIFMRLLGFGDIQLTAVAVSETAVLDVVIMMDVSESMLFDTTYDDWARIGYGKVYVPPRVGGNIEPIINDNNGDRIANVGIDTASWDALEQGTVFQKEFDNQLSGLGGVTTWLPHDLDHDSFLQPMWDDLIINSTHEQISQRLYYTDGDNSAAADLDYRVQMFDHPTISGPHQQPRPLCRVRFWPYSTRVPIRQEVTTLYTDTPGITYNYDKWDGFVPTYDFYGCCNDPTENGQIDEEYNLTEMSVGGGITNVGDFRFNDLICQPFKQARDATRQFLERVDFARGDRVAFVTFDKGAFLIDPDGTLGAPDTPCPDDERLDDITNRTNLTHMIESKCRAINTLETHMGVRAEPNSYVWKDEGGWAGFADGLDENGASKPINYQDTNIGTASLNTYPVRDHCPLQNGSLDYFRSRYSLWERGELGQLGAGRPGLVRIMIPSTTSGPWASTHVDERNSYELWASCRNTNIGAALRTGSSALLDERTTRSTGTVWVMVLLGDGAAGGSDPVRQNGRKLHDGSFTNADGIYTEPSVYADLGNNKSNWENWAGFTNNIRYGTNNDGRRAEYGVFGVCPFGNPNGGESSLTRRYATDEVARFPFCSDEDPDSRHFAIPPHQAEALREEVGRTCEGGSGATLQPGFSPGAKDEDYDCNPTLLPGETRDSWNLDAGNVYDLDIGQWNFYGQQVGTSIFDPMYDVDDYARDWADYIALSRGSGDEQLPTIFTIGFGLNFENDSPTPGLEPSDGAYIPGPQSSNTPDYLGEELLRYIADVGDNFQVDTDYQQDWLDNGVRDNSVTDYGVRGPCERQGVPAGTYAPLPPRESCGNYYNAPSKEQLELVFDDIASRMFTRLTG